MKFFVNSRIFEKFPDLYLGVAIVKGLNNIGAADELRLLISVQQEEIRVNISSERLSQIPINIKISQSLDIL